MIKKYLFVLLVLIMSLPNVFSGAYDDLDVNSVYNLNNNNFSDATGNYPSATNFGTTNISGIVKDGRDFSGTNQYLEFASNDLNSTWTIGYWINVDSFTAGDSHMVTPALSGNDFLAGFQVITTNRVEGRVRVGGANSIVTETSIITLGTDNHYVYTCDGSNLRMYKNSILEATASTPNGCNIDADIFRSGSDHTLGNDYDGQMDIITFFNEALNQSKVDELYNSNAGEEYIPTAPMVEELIITLVQPTLGQNFTFDVPSTTMNIMTNRNASCSVDNNFSGNTTLTTSDNQNHSTTYFLNNATNESQSYTPQVRCEDATINQTKFVNTSFNQAGEPLELQIFVSLDMQEFNEDVNQIEFHIETNYVAVCDYDVFNMTAPENFTQTGNIVHKTNYSVFYPDIDTYPSNFTCSGVFVAESVNSSVTFLLIADEIVTPTGTLTDTTSQLPQVGSDIGNFTINLSPGVVAFIFVFGIIGMIIGILSVFFLSIKTFKV